MELRVIGSHSAGNSYALVADNEILLLEAGCKYKDMAKAIDHRIDEVVGCVCSHRHFDHFKYALDYSEHGITILGCKDAIESQPFRYGRGYFLEENKTVDIGSFRVTPIAMCHDVEIYGYLVYHKSCGILLFATDTFKIPQTITGIDHFLIEANYSDALLKENVWNGNINKAQADRIMLSHMSLDYCVQYLRDCKAEETAKTITLCHLSERNSNPELFRETVAGAFGIPCYCATIGLIVELNKDKL